LKQEEAVGREPLFRENLSLEAEELTMVRSGYQEKTSGDIAGW
jgi:hypothetical protein